jgi:signal transduction histidine kinase
MPDYVIRILLYIYIIAMCILKGDFSYFSIASMLIIMITNIIIDRYCNSKLIILIQVIIIIIISLYRPHFITFLGLCSYELLKKEDYFGMFLIIPIILIKNINDIPMELLCFAVINFYGYVNCKYLKQQERFKKLYDNERRTRYELEGAKNRLLRYSIEVEHLTQVKERNRIARDIHDTIGHSLAGIHMQLQAAIKLKNKDREKSDYLVEKSSHQVSNTLTLLRKTVHNMKPSESIGINYILKIINEFKFCKVNFRYSGDFNDVSSSIMQIMASNIKEALTNVSKHSNADIVEIELQANEKYIRLYIKDNGVGCNNFKEGMGISGIKERIKNVGGSVSIDCKDGFLIVCVIPTKKLGVNIFENTDSR